MGATASNSSMSPGARDWLISIVNQARSLKALQ
jgi:hypothetical protein